MAAPNGRKPAEGLLRLTDDEEDLLSRQLVWLYRFSQKNQTDVRLDILVRNGQIFSNMRLPFGTLPPDEAEGQAGVRSDIVKIDARLSSLFGWCEQTRSQAELLISIAEGKICKYEMSLGQKL